MKIPKFIFIKGDKWKVRRKKKLFHEDGTPCYGLAVWETKTIWLETSLKGKLLEKIFWHEVIHGIMDESGVSNGLPEPMQEIMADAGADFLVKNCIIKFKRKRK